MMFRFPSVICTRCTGFFCLAIIKGPPNDIYCIIEEPYKHYFTEKVSYSRIGRNGGAPRQFVRKTDVFPTQCLLKSGFVSRISSPPFRPVRVRFRSHPNQCPAPRHVSPLPPHPPPTRRPLFL